MSWRTSRRLRDYEEYIVEFTEEIDEAYAELGEQISTLVGLVEGIEYVDEEPAPYVDDFEDE